MATQESTLSRRTRTATRIGVGAAIIGMEKAGELLDAVAGREELPALPPGDVVAEGGPAEPGAEPAVPGRPPMSDRRALTLGAVFAAEEGAVAAIEGISRAGHRVGALADRTWRLTTPEPIRIRVDDRIASMRQRGRNEDEPSRSEAAEAFGEAVEGVVGGPWLVEMINEIVGEVLDPIIETALPVVMNRLQEEPEVIQDLVRNQSVGMAGEITNGVRSGAISVDSGLERMARRLTFRHRRAELGGPALNQGPPPADDS